MLDNFDSFFYSTGEADANFEKEVTQAKKFGVKFQETFSPEFKSSMDEVRGRVERLNAKDPVVLGVPNSIVYYFVAAGFLYVGYKLLFD